jgi:hypothetical protein
MQLAPLRQRAPRLAISRTKGTPAPTPVTINNQTINAENVVIVINNFHPKPDEPKPP